MKILKTNGSAQKATKKTKNSKKPARQDLQDKQDIVFFAKRLGILILGPPREIFTP